MKIRGFIVAGVILLGAGIGVSAYACSRSDFNLNEFSTKEIKLVDNYYKKDTVKKININASADSVRIVESDREDIYVRSKVAKTREYSISLDDMVLSIKNKENYNWFQSFVNFRWNEIWGFSKEKLIVEVPRGMEYDYDIEMSAGEVEIKGVNANTIDGDFSAITASIDDVTANVFNLEASASTVNVDNLCIGTVTGDFSASTINFNAKITTKADFNISAGTLNLSFVDSKDNYKINGNGTGVVVDIESSASTVNY